MKKVVLVLMLALVGLHGCSAAELETVADTQPYLQIQQQRRLCLSLPPEAAQPVAEAGGDRLYLCDGFEIQIRTIPASDPYLVLRQVTGLDRAVLTVLQRRQKDGTRYDCSWCSAGETGAMIGRAAMLQAGPWCYCVSMLAPEAEAREAVEAWQKITADMCLQ